MKLLDGNVSIRVLLYVFILMGLVWTFEQWVVEQNIKALRQEVQQCLITDTDY